MAEIRYGLLCAQLKEFMEEDPYWLPVLSNAAALLYGTLPDLNWAGFYLVDGESLVLGPFQGKTACIRIDKGKGVCGTAWEKDETQCVPDVHAFPGHIACDSASRSEIVLPLHRADGSIFGVLDIDSPLPARFGEKERAGLSEFVKVLESLIDLREHR